MLYGTTDFYFSEHVSIFGDVFSEFLLSRACLKIQSSTKWKVHLTENNFQTCSKVTKRILRIYCERKGRRGTARRQFFFYPFIAHVRNIFLNGIMLNSYSDKEEKENFIFLSKKQESNAQKKEKYA